MNMNDPVCPPPADLPAKPSDQLSDERIVELYFARDEKAIASTDRKYGRLLLSVARGFLTDEQDCEECVNDTYLKAWNAIPPAHPRSLCAFLSQILRRVAINRYHEIHAKSRIPTEYTTSLDELSEVLSTHESTEDEVSGKELSRLINDWLSTLSARERYVFIGRFYMAQTLESLASDLHVHVSTVHREIERIKRSLKEHLERNGVTV